MKKILFVFLVLFVFCGNSFASTIYLPTESINQYLPTVKVFAYSLSYDGSLIGEGYGSGTLIDSEGTILTNNHVVEDYWDPAQTYDAFQVCLTKSNDPREPICEFTASFLERNQDTDLALLKMDQNDVRGNRINFDFYLPYDNDSDYKIGDIVTAVGYPDTGGRTITYTSGLISGFLTEAGTSYIKTDADISFGSSGGTAVDDDGNFIGVPTYIMGSYSAEVLGYLFPVEDAEDWIDQNVNNTPVKNELANSQLRETVLANITANEKGYYKNDYPPYEISIIEGWKFGNSLEGSFEGGGYGSSQEGESVTIYPVDRSDTSQLYIDISVTDYAYDVTLDDIEYILNSYAEDYSNDYYEDESSYSYEKTEFNDYPAVKEVYSYYDWWYEQDMNTVTYYIPYGDNVINILYNYTGEDEDETDEVNKILGTFEVDMSQIKTSVVDVIESEYPIIRVENPLDDIYLSDDSYEYDNEYYFGASFGKKMDYDFYIDIYSNYYWEEKYMGDFDLFKEESLADAEEWYNVVSQGELKIDGHDGFYYTDEYDGGVGDLKYYTTIYIDNDDETYFTIYYSADGKSYKENLSGFKLILKNIQLDNYGEGRYLIPNFLGRSVRETGEALSDVDNYIYEDSIRNLDDEGAFGEETPSDFNPAGFLTRGDFLKWAVRTLQGEAGNEFEEFENNYSECDICFTDIKKGSELEMYTDFAYTKGAVGGLSIDGQYFLYPENKVSLVAALKIIFELYDYEKWEAPAYLPWYISYLHLGYSEYVIPYGVSDVNYLLTRGEGAFIIEGIMTANYYSDDYWY
ncbi:trypsin-like serine protease [Candidatus Peregrinibacteria bacterium]|nr:trypsin-like serine protease [Candidatus Peregrinibacteria bacterium]